jgi:hypothetical protein
MPKPSATPKWSGYRKAKLKTRLLKRIAKQNRPNACWLWAGARSHNGYGTIWASGETCYTHRLAYELWVGPIPEGMWVLHRCNEHACCNPRHLFTGRARISLEERLLRKIEKQPDGCWIWQGETNQGYGQINLSGRRRTVHRVAYELWIEAIPKGLQVQHLCSNRRCCNPDHLVTATAAETARHMLERRRNGNKGYAESVACVDALGQFRTPAVRRPARRLCRASF